MESAYKLRNKKKTFWIGNAAEFYMDVRINHKFTRTSRMDIHGSTRKPLNYTYVREYAYIHGFTHITMDICVYPWIYAYMNGWMD